jgi:uncharacterized protein (DUF305 family)
MITQSTFSNSTVRQFAVASLAAFLAWPVAHAETTQPGMGYMKPGMAASAAMGAGNMMGAGDMDMKAMMGSMNEKMSAMPMSGNTDVDFAAMMRVHHQGAINMAEAELKTGKNARMRTMAKNIISAQKKEIEQLEKFLAAQGQPADKMKMTK